MAKWPSNPSRLIRRKMSWHLRPPYGICGLVIGQNEAEWCVQVSLSFLPRALSRRTPGFPAGLLACWYPRSVAGMGKLSRLFDTAWYRAKQAFRPAKERKKARSSVQYGYCGSKFNLEKDAVLDSLVAWRAMRYRWVMILIWTCRKRDIGIAFVSGVRTAEMRLRCLWDNGLPWRLESRCH
jgi:hypothetical protein